jgi:hypothetical protein
MKCPNCDHEIYTAEVCPWCGATTGASSPPPSEDTDRKPPAILDQPRDPNATFIARPSANDRPGVVSGWGTKRFHPSMAIVLHIDEATEPLIIEPAERFIVGRLDRQRGIAPDLDLTPYGAVEKGISREHAEMRSSEDELVLVDLGSTNGTFINENQLTPSVPEVLHDGDLIRLGQMRLHIYFTQSSRSTQDAGK